MRIFVRLRMICVIEIIMYTSQRRIIMLGYETNTEHERYTRSTECYCAIYTRT